MSCPARCGGGSSGVSRWPARGRSGRGGLLMGGSSISWRRASGASASTAALFWGWFGTWAMGWVVSGTLLGPEGSGVSPVFQFGPHLLVVPAVPVVGVARAGVWWGSARMLRTTQWTRASL